jgi:hypothetical protein
MMYSPAGIDVSPTVKLKGILAFTAGSWATSPVAAARVAMVNRAIALIRFMRVSPSIEASFVRLPSLVKAGTLGDS